MIDTNECGGDGVYFVNLITDFESVSLKLSNCRCIEIVVSEGIFFFHH